MGNVKYSLTTFIEDLLKLQNNSYNLITKLGEVVQSNSDLVEIDTLGDDNVIKKVMIPSFGSMKNELNRLNSNIEKFTNIDSNANIQLKDGSFRKILVDSLKREAEDIKNIKTPTKFNIRENWFFESLLNPLLYVSFNLDEQLKYNTTSVETERYILELDTEEKLNFFKSNLENKSNIKYQTFLNILQTNNIKYYLDKDVISLPPRKLKYTGNFSVLNVYADTIENSIDGVIYNKNVLKVKLDTLNYNDSESEFLGTRQLKINDDLIVNRGDKNTRYKIINIENGKRIVYLDRIEGFDGIQIGTNELSFYENNTQNIQIDVNIGFDEYSVIFIKPIDPDSKISAVNWSPGVGVYTNSLLMEDDNGNEITLETFYHNNVVDFGAYLFSMSKDKIIPTEYGIKPEPPELIENNFKVVQINEHRLSDSNVDALKKLQSDKTKTESKIKVLNNNISNLKDKLNSIEYSSKNEKNSDKEQLQLLILEKSSESELFDSIVSDINKLSIANDLSNIKPKYRVRGFFDIPKSVQTTRFGEQSIVQFKIRYRYLTKSGSSNNIKQLEFSDVDNNQRYASFSNWVDIKSDVRERIKSDDGTYQWVVEDLENGNEININQIDIPINSNEIVEFKVKAISESGFPINPIESDWSNTIKIEFPETLESQSDILDIVLDNEKQKTRLEFQKELESSGIIEHVSSSFTSGNKYYPHNSNDISSGFLTEEQTIISLFDKLVEMDNEIKRLSSLITNIKSELDVRIIDEDGNEYNINNNKELKLFAGYYKDEVENIQVKKGEIVTKTYFLQIKNKNNTNLDLYSYVFGSENIKIGDNNSYEDSLQSDAENYGLAPLTFLNQESKNGIIYDYPNQSSQISGQFINVRDKKLDGVTSLYEKNINDEYVGLNSTPVGGGAMSDINYIWNGNINNGFISSITDEDYLYVHNLHPLIQNNELNSIKATNSKLAVNTKSTTNYLLQNSFKNGDSKIGFVPNDKYLIGKYSCGAYLFLNPTDISEIRVDGNDRNSRRNLPIDEVITIPIVFQYRMTDFYGSGESGIGNIGGRTDLSSDANIEYEKTIGLDIYYDLLHKEKFSFDLTINAKYKSNTHSSKNVPNKDFSSAIDDLNVTLKKINPTLNRDFSRL